LLVLSAGAVAANSPDAAAVTGDAMIEHTVQSLAGDSVDLSTFRGKALLIVNTASKCGYTSQYDGLQKIHEQFPSIQLNESSEEHGWATIGPVSESPTNTSVRCHAIFGITPMNWCRRARLRRHGIK